jgi:hypothetical protein
MPSGETFRIVALEGGGEEFWSSRAGDLMLTASTAKLNYTMYVKAANLAEIVRRVKIPTLA